MIDSITVNIPKLVGLGLNANQYMRLALIYHNLPTDLAPLSTADMDILIEKEYLAVMMTTEYLLPKGKALFEASEKFIDTAFNELYQLYPRQVPDSRGGYRVLRSKALDSEDAKICKRKYEIAIKNDKNLHAKVIKGLKTELVMRRNSMTYMQNMQTWINQRGWEKYMDLEMESRDDDRISSI